MRVVKQLLPFGRFGFRSKAEAAIIGHVFDDQNPSIRESVLIHGRKRCCVDFLHTSIHCIPEPT